MGSTQRYEIPLTPTTGGGLRVAGTDDTPEADESQANDEQPQLEVPEGVDPSAIPEKFRRQDGKVDWASFTKEYQFLASRQGTPSNEKQEGTPPPAKGQEGKPELTPEAAYPFLQEFKATGRLSPTSYKIIEQQYGYTAPQIDTMIRAQQDRETVYYNALSDAVGGREAWAEMAAWADRALPPGRAQYFAEQIHSMQEGVGVNAALALKAEWEAATQGVRGSLLQGSPDHGVDGVKPFKDVAEKDRALRKKNDRGQFLFQVDPEYRAEVEARHDAMLRRDMNLRSRR